MEQTPARPPDPRPAETWSCLALRSPSGRFLVSGRAWVLMTDATPYGVEHWATEEEYRAWLADRPAFFRNQIRSHGFELVEHRVAIRPLAAPDHAANRPLVAEACVDA